MPFDFNQAQPLAEAIDSISAKTPVGATLKSGEWAAVPAQLRESAMFSARVESVRAMQSVKDALESILKGDRDPVTGALKMDRSKFIETIQKTANQLGLRTQEQGKKGSIEDFGSERRLKLIYEQQIGAAQARAYWLQGMDPDVLDGWPAQELVRVADRKKKRDWKRRWLDAASAVGMQGVSASGMAAGRMIALKTSPIWIKLSRLQRPYPPFDYNSGMGVEERDREDAEKWGLLSKGERIEPNVQNYQDSLAASVQGLDEQMRAALKKIFGDQVTIEGDTAKWNPNKEQAKAPPAEERTQASSEVPAAPPEPTPAPKAPIEEPTQAGPPQFATLGEAKQFFTDRGVAQVSDVSPSAKTWGRQLPEPARLAHLQTLAEELYRLEQTFPNIPTDQLNTLLAVHSERGRAHLDGPAAMLSTKAEEWSDASWQNIRAWEKANGRNWGTERQGSQVKDNFRHELGHTFSTPAVLREWDAVVKQYKLKWFKENVSEYAGTNAWEALADSFGMATRENYVRGTLPAEIERVVFNVILGEA